MLSRLQSCMVLCISHYFLSFTPIILRPMYVKRKSKQKSNQMISVSITRLYVTKKISSILKQLFTISVHVIFGNRLSRKTCFMTDSDLPINIPNFA